MQELGLATNSYEVQEKASDVPNEKPSRDCRSSHLKSLLLKSLHCHIGRHAIPTNQAQSADIENCALSLQWVEAFCPGCAIFIGSLAKNTASCCSTSVHRCRTKSNSGFSMPLRRLSQRRSSGPRKRGGREAEFLHAWGLACRIHYHGLRLHRDGGVQEWHFLISWHLANWEIDSLARGVAVPQIGQVRAHS
jgi:hypothetical protein